MQVVPDPTPRRSEAASLGERAYEQLVEMIVGAKLPGGTALSERRLCQDLGMSRSPVRSALGKLESEGLVVRDASGTPTVCRVTVKDYLDALQVRRLLEPAAARLAAGHVDTPTLESLRRDIEAMQNRAVDPPSEHHWRVEERLHHTIADASGNPLMAEAIKRVRNRGRLFDLRRMPDRFLPGCREHLAIVSAVERGNADAAEAAMADHIDAVRQSVLDGLAQG
jgi:DNA-binding GntR family transcriptional regulator